MPISSGCSAMKGSTSVTRSTSGITRGSWWSYASSRRPEASIGRPREEHDALKRRCLYQWIEYPAFEKEMAIVRARVPHAREQLARQVAALVHELRGLELYKVPGVSE